MLVVGYYALTTLDAQTTAIGYLWRLLPVGVGMGIFQSPNNSAIMGSVRRERLGITSGLLSISRVLGQTVGLATSGAYWAGRVSVYTGAILAGGATTASTSAQVAGLQDTFRAILALIALGLVLSIWGLVQERRLQRRASAVQVNP